METKSQMLHAMNAQPDNQTETLPLLNTVERGGTEIENASYPAGIEKPLLTEDIHMMKNYSQFFVELS